MIDWSKPVECNKGPVIAFEECAECGQHVNCKDVIYWVNPVHGEPTSDALINNDYTVRNVKSNRDRAIEMANGMLNTNPTYIGLAAMIVDDFIKEGLISE